MMNRNKLTGLSFLLSVLVLYIHANNLSYFVLNDSQGFVRQIETFISETLGLVAVPTFFVISGAQFFLNIDIIRNDNAKIIRNKIEKRIKTLFIPYLIWNFVGTVFYMIIPRIPVVDAIMRGSAVDFNLTNVVEGVFCYKYYFPFWYLAHLCVLMLCTPIFYILLKKRSLWIVLIVSAVMHLLGYNLKVISSSSIFFFCLGIYGVQVSKWMLMNYKKTDIKICAVIFVCSLIIRNHNAGTLISGILYLCSPIFLWISTENVNWHFVTKNKFFGQSFFIYCSHIIILSTVGRLLAKFYASDGSAFKILICYIITPIITLCIIWGIQKILKRYFEKVYQVICGGRG